MFLCSDYQHPCNPFIVSNDVLPNAPAGEQWQYLSECVFGGAWGGGPGTGYTPLLLYDTLYMCPNDSLIIKAPHGYSIYHWDNGSTDSLMTITSRGAYRVTGIGPVNQAFIDSIYVIINPELCNCAAFLPDGFTPNGDEHNDTYHPVFRNGCYVSKYEFSIFSRWGQLVFHSENPADRWDGTFGGVPAEMGVYMYYLKYTTNTQFPQHERTGDVTLIR